MLYKEQSGIRKFINHVGGALEAKVSQGAELLGQATGPTAACSFSKTANVLDQMPCDGSHGTPEQTKNYTPGKHRIKRALKVSDGPMLGAETTANLDPGMIVDVLEVIHSADINRVRACIKEPQGWISLQDLSTGDCYAEKVEKVYVQACSFKRHDTVALSLKATGALEAQVPNGTLLALEHEDSDALVVIYDGKRCMLAKHDRLLNIFDALGDCEF
jgi:hypothetical protein